MSSYHGLIGLAALSCVLLLPPALRAESPWLYGVHWYDTDGDVESMTGGKSVWILETVMTYDGSWNASARRDRMQTAVDRGHTIICRIQPQWGMAVPDENGMSAYLNAVRDAAETLRDACHIWQIGNEMDNPAEYGGDLLLPEVYVDRFKRIRAAIKEVDSPLGEQQVLLGPTSAFARWYLTGMLTHLDPSDVDGIAIHAYGLDPDTIVWNSIANFTAAYTEAIDVIDDHGFEYKPVYITEFDRCASPANDAIQEPASSEFLYQAYDNLNQYNQTPGVHPIVAAIWFIYPDDGAWSCYSLRRHKSGPRGEDVNLWDAFQFAATKDYPSGATAKALGVSTQTINREHRVGSDSAPDTIAILNLGTGHMAYQIVSDVDWLTVSPNSGWSSGERDPIEISYSLDDQPSAPYNASLTISAEGAMRSPITVDITIDLLPAPGDADRDGDVDQVDFGVLQRCLVPSGEIQSDPACRFVNLDGDTDVDLNDLQIFRYCMTGSNIIADPACDALPQP